MAVYKYNCFGNVYVCMLNVVLCSMCYCCRCPSLPLTGACFNISSDMSTDSIFSSLRLGFQYSIWKRWKTNVISVYCTYYPIICNGNDLVPKLSQLSCAIQHQMHTELTDIAVNNSEYIIYPLLHNMGQK